MANLLALWLGSMGPQHKGELGAVHQDSMAQDALQASDTR
ncbi:MAG: hypothetical protein ACI9VR_002997 [Cognaticolwellia sp.]|jgi:hypothetical protein